MSRCIKFFKPLFLVALLGVPLLLAAQEKEDKPDKKTIKKLMDWVSVFTQYSNVNLSDKVDLKEYGEVADLAKSALTNPELGAKLASFKEATSVNVYPLGMMGGNEWIVAKLNRLSRAQYSVLNAPYLTLEVWFTPDATASSYTVAALFKTTEDKLRPAVLKVNPALSSALTGKTYAQPRLAKADVNAALFAALGTLQVEIGSSFTPAIAIRYNDQRYTHNQTIEVWQKANEGITLQAVDKDNVPLTGTLTWAGVTGSGNTVTFPIGKAGLERITLKRGKDEMSVLIKVKEFSLNPEDLIKQIVRQLLLEKNNSSADSIKLLQKDSVVVSQELSKKLIDYGSGISFSQDGNPVPESVQTQVVKIENNERILSSIEVGNIKADPKRKIILELLAKKWKGLKALASLLRLKVLINTLIDDPAKLETFIKSLGNDMEKLVANLVVNGMKKDTETEIRKIIAKFVNDKIEALVDEN
jgi:hypothetical protein